MRILFVHGRDQQGKSSAQLLSEWGAALETGLQSAGVTLPKHLHRDMPFYGDTLIDFVDRANLPSGADLVSMGPSSDPAFDDFKRAFVEDLAGMAGITDDQIRARMPEQEVTEMGPQNWEWVQAIVAAIDDAFPGVSSAFLEAFIRDVFLYLDKGVVRQAIDAIVHNELTNEPTLVVAHSLGSVVAYNILRQEAAQRNILGFVTLGSPLGIKAINRKLRPLANPVANSWWNGYDSRDIVALNPLDGEHFPVSPPIAEFGGIHNQTSNRHGIAGYLDKAEVVSAIHGYLR